MKKLFQNLTLLMLLLVSGTLGVFAQTRTVTGIVRDASDVVIGASVIVKGNASVGTITDMDALVSTKKSK